MSHHRSVSCTYKDGYEGPLACGVSWCAARHWPQPPLEYRHLEQPSFGAAARGAADSLPCAIPHDRLQIGAKHLLS